MTVAPECVNLHGEKRIDILRCLFRLQPRSVVIKLLTKLLTKALTDGTRSCLECPRGFAVCRGITKVVGGSELVARDLSLTFYRSTEGSWLFISTQPLRDEFEGLGVPG